MSEKYSTEEMIRWLKSYCLFGSNRDAIIAKLRAADKLCEAAKTALDPINEMINGKKEFTTVNFKGLAEAIAEYEGGQ